MKRKDYYSRSYLVDMRQSFIFTHQSSPDTMKLLYNEAISSHRLAASELSLMKAQRKPSLLNINLKTHSLIRLNVPLETSIGFNKLSSLHPTENHTASIDLISEMHQPTCTNGKDDHLQSGKQPCLDIPQRRFRRAHSFITPAIVNDSIVRLRRISNAQNHHRSSLQTVDRACESKGRSSSIREFTSYYLSTDIVSVQVLDQFQSSAFVTFPPRSSTRVKLRSLRLRRYPRFDHSSNVTVRNRSKTSALFLNHLNYWHHPLGKDPVLGRGNRSGTRLRKTRDRASLLYRRLSNHLYHNVVQCKTSIQPVDQSRRDSFNARAPIVCFVAIVDRRSLIHSGNINRPCLNRSPTMRSPRLNLPFNPPVVILRLHCSHVLVTDPSTMANFTRRRRSPRSMTIPFPTPVPSVRVWTVFTNAQNMITPR
jgi:hypothetical protein